MTRHSEKEKVLFVDGTAEALYGDQVRDKLTTKNDRGRLIKHKGVIHVDQQRWQEAQQFERTVWMERGRQYREDANTLRRMLFDNYGVLEGQRFTNAIELGCGPFTNMRHILNYVAAERVHLLDPLLTEYLRHPHCTYRHGRLRLGLGKWRDRLKLGKRVPATLHTSAIETFSTRERFDLIVMINVLEHCYDAQAIFDAIHALSQPGAVLVFAEKYYEAEKLHRELQLRYDAGHPLKVDRTVIDSFLNTYFTPLYHTVDHIAHSKPNSSWTSYDELYFIGRHK